MKDATFAENFYGLKRVPLANGGIALNHWRSLAVVVGVPIAKRYFDELHAFYAQSPQPQSKVSSMDINNIPLKF